MGSVFHQDLEVSQGKGREVLSLVPLSFYCKPGSSRRWQEGIVGEMTWFEAAKDLRGTHFNYVFYLSVWLCFSSNFVNVVITFILYVFRAPWFKGSERVSWGRSVHILSIKINVCLLQTRFLVRHLVRATCRLSLMDQNNIENLT